MSEAPRMSCAIVSARLVFAALLITKLFLRMAVSTSTADDRVV